MYCDKCSVGNLREQHRISQQIFTPCLSKLKMQNSYLEDMLLAYFNSAITMPSKPGKNY